MAKPRGAILEKDIVLIETVMPKHIVTRVVRGR